MPHPAEQRPDDHPAPPETAEPAQPARPTPAEPSTQSTRPAAAEPSNRSARPPAAEPGIDPARSVAAEPNARPTQPDTAEPDNRPARVVRSWVLPAALVAVILVAAGLWFSQDPPAPAPAPQAAPVPTLTAGPTMRITAPGADSSAGIGSEKAPAGPATANVRNSASSSAAAPTSRATKPPKSKPAAPVNSSGRNLALGAKATASSVEHHVWKAAYAVDDDATTRWSSEFSDPQWLTVDLGKTWAISEVLLHWENAHATAYRVDISADGQKWKQIFSTTDGQGGDVTVPVANVPTRMIRMYGTKRSTQYGYSLLGVEVR